MRGHRAPHTLLAGDPCPGVALALWATQTDRRRLTRYSARPRGRRGARPGRARAILTLRWWRRSRL